MDSSHQLQFAIQHRNLDRVIAIVSKNPTWVEEMDSDGGYPIHRAIFYDQLEIAKYLVRVGGSKILKLFAPQRKSVLHSAVESESLEMVRWVVELDDTLLFQSDIVQYTPLHYAIIAGYTAIAKFLIAAGSELDAVDAYDSTSLHMAATYNRGEIAKELLQKGTLAGRMRDQQGQTPFQLAAQCHCDPGMITMFIQSGSEIDYIDSHASTLLHAIAERNRLELMDLYLPRLQKYLARPNKLGQTPFHLAISRCHAKMVVRLGQACSNSQMLTVISMVDIYGQTVLHLALSRNNLQMGTIVRYLLRAGAGNFDLCNLEGETPWKLARKSALPGIARVVAACSDNIAHREEIGLEEYSVVDIRYRMWFAQSLMNRLLEWC